jgi:hypothetical protein
MPSPPPPDDLTAAIQRGADALEREPGPTAAEVARAKSVWRRYFGTRSVLFAGIDLMSSRPTTTPANPANLTNLH